MIRLSPYDPEIEAIWRALTAANAFSVAVVSAMPGEGATLIAGAIARRAGLAGALREPDGASEDAAGGGLPGLLVDLNLARPAVSGLLGLTPRPGEIVRMDALGLAVLGDPGADGWREAAAIRARLAGWRRQWSMVVFDTAPLLSRDVGALSGGTVAAAADAAILVTLAGRTSASHIREARDALNAAGVRLIGSVLNDRDNPSLLSELERETYRLAPVLPRAMASLRGRMRRSTLLGVRV